MFLVFVSSLVYHPQIQETNLQHIIPQYTQSTTYIFNFHLFISNFGIVRMVNSKRVYVLENQIRFIRAEVIFDEKLSLFFGKENKRMHFADVFVFEGDGAVFSSDGDRHSVLQEGVVGSFVIFVVHSDLNRMFVIIFLRIEH